MKAPDYTNELAGVRIWRVAPNLWAQLGGLLWAPSVREPWSTGEKYEATCNTCPDHRPPHEGCMCGLYAFLDPMQAQWGGYWPHPQDELYTRLVAGVVAASGEIELCEWGFRAQYGRVVAIFENGADDDELPIPRGVIAEAYDAEVIDLFEFDDFCERAGLLNFRTDGLPPPY
jgi:hypothetical protein